MPQLHVSAPAALPSPPRGVGKTAAILWFAVAGLTSCAGARPATSARPGVAAAPAPSPGPHPAASVRPGVSAAPAASPGPTAGLPGGPPPSPDAVAVARQVETPLPPPIVVVATSGAPFFVAGCNVECVNCATIDRNTFVVAETADGRPLYGGPTTPSGPYSCGASVAVGTSLTLRARGSASFEFVRWRKFGAPYRADYCPCDGSTNPICELTIEPQVAAHHPRAYCGAVWRNRGGSGPAIATP